MTIEKHLNPEMRTASEQSRRMEKSADLMGNPIRDGQIGYDKVFIKAEEVVQDGNFWTIKINSKDSTVVLDNKWKESLGLTGSSIVSDIRSGVENRTLISGGTWIWIEDDNHKRFLALMRRDSGAPVDAHCLTGPAGRCGEKLSKTSVDETNQEFIFVKLDDGNEKLLAFYRDEEDKEEVIRQKLRQVGEVYKALMDRYEKTGDEKSRDDAKYLVDRIKSREDIQLLDMGVSKDEKETLDTVIMTIDGEEVDRVRGIAFMDNKNRTLEVREIKVITLPSGSSLSKVMDGEIFLRTTVLVPEDELEDLLQDDLVPALRNYIEKVV